jgi:adenine-specific DNA-methyltransferase
MLTPQSYPSFIKYMGSKSKIIDFVIEGINQTHTPNTPILDLFAGSASLAGAVGKQVDFVSNDIQEYSKVLAQAYVSSKATKDSPTPEKILLEASSIVAANKLSTGVPLPAYDAGLSLEQFNELEKSQQKLINNKYKHDWHLFFKNYSGTWWSAEQCLWIDALRQVAATYEDDSSYQLILASLMFAMAYCSQGTGHYAQYRDAKTKSSLKDIQTYRKKSVAAYFSKKYSELYSLGSAQESKFSFSYKTSDYKDALKDFSEGTVYADPPYCFVHYSRFYHILETLALYDYPDLQFKNDEIVKGRYRVERHQSPFCIKSKVEGAFDDLFKGVHSGGSNLVLSYSNTGMIELDRMLELASCYWDAGSIEILTTDHQHMTLGRKGIRHRDVKECLMMVKS